MFIVHVHKAKILGEWYDLELDEEDSQGMGEGDGEEVDERIQITDGNEERMWKGKMGKKCFYLCQWWSSLPVCTRLMGPLVKIDPSTCLQIHLQTYSFGTFQVLEP